MGFKLQMPHAHTHTQRHKHQIVLNVQWEKREMNIVPNSDTLHSRLYLNQIIVKYFKHYERIKQREKKIITQTHEYKAHKEIKTHIGFEAHRQQ